MFSCFMPVSWLTRVVTLLSLVVLCHGVVLSTPSPAHAQTAPAASSQGNLISSGISMFEDQRYEESIQTLTAALLRPGKSRRDRIDIYRYLAFNYVVLSRMDEAEAAARGLFALDPSFTLSSNESPRFRDFFNQAKKHWEQEGRPGATSDSGASRDVAIRHSSPAQRERERAVEISGQIDDSGDRIAAVSVRYRAGTQGKFAELNAPYADGKFRAVIPASAVKPPLVEYYIEARDKAGLPVATRGDAAAPMRISISSSSVTGILTNPWLWVGAGVLVAGSIATGILLAGKSGSDPGPNGNPMSRVVVVVGQ